MLDRSLDDRTEAARTSEELVRLVEGRSDRDTTSLATSSGGCAYFTGVFTLSLDRDPTRRFVPCTTRHACKNVDGREVGVRKPFSGVSANRCRRDGRLDVRMGDDPNFLTDLLLAPNVRRGSPKIAPMMSMRRDG